MPSGRVRFKESELARALRAMKKEGIAVDKISLTKDGAEIIVGDGRQRIGRDTEAPNPWHKS